MLAFYSDPLFLSIVLLDAQLSLAVRLPLRLIFSVLFNSTLSCIRANKCAYIRCTRHYIVDLLRNAMFRRC